MANSHIKLLSFIISKIQIKKKFQHAHLFIFFYELVIWVCLQSRNTKGLGKTKFILSTGPRARRVPEIACNTGPHGITDGQKAEYKSESSV
jgi:hypothetical protein